MPAIRRRRPARAKKVIRRKRMPKGKAMNKRKSDYATLVEGAETPLKLNNTGSYGYNFTTSLSEFQRAQEVAHAYKYYRAAKVELQFVPYANFSAVGGAAASSLPQLYFTVDRVANQFIIPTESEMIERGISPRLFKKKMVFSWKPSLLQNVQLETNQPADGGGLPLGINLINAINSIPLFNKWLPTQQSFGFTTNPATGQPQTGAEMVQPSVNPYALRYYGATFLIDQENSTTEQVIGDLITRVTWEFKGPRALVTAAPGKQIQVSPATSSTTGVLPNTQGTNYP